MDAIEASGTSAVQFFVQAGVNLSFQNTDKLLKYRLHIHCSSMKEIKSASRKDTFKEGEKVHIFEFKFFIMFKGELRLNSIQYDHGNFPFFTILGYSFVRRTCL